MIQISFAKSTNVELVEVGLGKVYRGTRYERGGLMSCWELHLLIQEKMGFDYHS